MSEFTKVIYHKSTGEVLLLGDEVVKHNNTYDCLFKSANVKRLYSVTDKKTGNVVLFIGLDHAKDHIGNRVTLLAEAAAYGGDFDEIMIPQTMLRFRLDRLDAKTLNSVLELESNG